MNSERHGGVMDGFMVLSRDDYVIVLPARPGLDLYSLVPDASKVGGGLLHRWSVSIM